MSLENEVKSLTEEMRELRLLLAAICKDMEFYRPDADPQTVENDDENVVPFPADSVDEHEQPHEDVPESPVTVESVQAKCLALSRADKANREKIRTTIAKYGAKTVPAIPTKKLPMLMAELEKL